MSLFCGRDIPPISLESTVLVYTIKCTHHLKKVFIDSLENTFRGSFFMTIFKVESSPFLPASVLFIFRFFQNNNNVGQVHMLNLP